MPVNSAVTASPPPHFGHGWMWVEWKSSLTDSLSHTHTYLLLLFSPSPPPPSPLLLTHTFSLSHQCVTVHVKTFSSIVLPLSLSFVPPLEPHSRFSVQSNNSCFHWLGSPCRFLSEISCTELISVEGEKRKLFWVLLLLLCFFKYIFFYTLSWLQYEWAGATLTLKKQNSQLCRLGGKRKTETKTTVAMKS